MQFDFEKPLNVPLVRPDLKGPPFMGEARCMICDKEWSIVAPTGLEAIGYSKDSMDLPCPKCANLSGCIQ